MRAFKVRFLPKIIGVTTLDKLHSNAIRESLNIESILFRVERSQLRWFSHLSRMPQERLPKQTLCAQVNGKRPVGKHEQDGLIIVRILVGTAGTFVEFGTYPTTFVKIIVALV